MTNVERLAILAEEFGEACKEAVEATWPRHMVAERARWLLRGELIQVAAVAVAWIEALDAEAVSR